MAGLSQYSYPVLFAVTRRADESWTLGLTCSGVAESKTKAFHASIPTSTKSVHS